MIANQYILDQRLQVGRRRNPPFVCLYQLGIKRGRRVAQRRSERGVAYVDQYEGHLVACVIAVVLFSATDAFLTLNILAGGGAELNYFMAVLIEEGTQKFISAKLALTSLAAIMLAIHHEAILCVGLRCRHLLYLLLLGYACLISYELLLLQLIAVVNS